MRHAEWQCLNGLDASMKMRTEAQAQNSFQWSGVATQIYVDVRSPRIAPQSSPRLVRRRTVGTDASRRVYRYCSDGCTMTALHCPSDSLADRIRAAQGRMVPYRAEVGACRLPIAARSHQTKHDRWIYQHGIYHHAVFRVSAIIFCPIIFAIFVP